MFGESAAKVQKPRIGYMPQESALILGFTVREMIWFFGTIFGMSSHKINERFEFLSNLLELPDEDRLIKDCSGGQQRRVSFALTLVHEPEILILDEPTVGVDPLLRCKIWDYLTEITRTKNVTVLLSTHYIEEARQSTHIGLMRHGVQIAEDTPDSILASCETTSLEDAFLSLSENQELDSFNRNSSRSLQTSYASYSKLNFDEYESLKTASSPPLRKVFKQSALKIVFALLVKNLLQILRNLE